MKSNKTLIAILILLVLMAVLLLRSRSTKTSVNLRPSAAVGEVLVEEIGRLLPDGGDIVLISREPSKEGPDANRERIESFQAALAARANLKLLPIEWLPRPPVGTMDLGVVSPEQLSAALDKNPRAKIFLILAGPPPYARTFSERLKASSQRLVLVSGYSANVKLWLESKTLAVAILPRFADLPANAPPPKTSRDWFDREYQIATPETLGSLPY